MTAEEERHEAAVQRVLELLEQNDSFQAIAEMHADVDSVCVARRFELAVRELFSQRKLPQMVWIGRSGVEYALREAERSTEGDLRQELLRMARTLSYNVSANLWPGWGDQAVTSTTSDLQAALDLARLHCRLVEQEKLGPDVLGNAHWLVGAQRLAMGQEQAAQHEFEAAGAAFSAENKPASQWMAEGFQALAIQLLGTTGTEGQRRFDAAIGELRKLGDDGEFFADQLQTAGRVFLVRPAE